MKKVMIAAMLMIGMTSFAQETAKPAKAERAKLEEFTPEQRQQLHLKKLTLDLNLSASQQKEFAALLKDSQAKREAAKAERKAQKEKGQKPTKDERFAMKNKMLDEQIAMKDKVRKILSAEQFEKWEKAQADRKNQFAHRMKSRKGHSDKKQ